MVFYILMIVLSPITALIPALYSSYYIYKGQIKIEWNYLNIGLGVLFIWSLIVALMNNSILSFGAAFLLFLYFVMSVSIGNYFVSRNKINKALKYVSYFTMIAAINGLLEKVIASFNGDNHFRVYSYFGNPNMAGAWFASCIFVIFYLKRINKAKKQNRIYNLGILLLLIALAYTESTGAIIAFVVALVSYVLVKRFKNLKRIIIALFSIGGIVGVLAVVQQTKIIRFGINEVINSFNSRVDIWKGAYKMFLEKPLTGWGLLGTLQHGGEYMTEYGNTIHAHNLWLTLLVSVGIIGLLVYLFIKVRLFKDIRKLYKKKEELLPMLVSLNMMVIVQGLVDCTLFAPQLAMLFIFGNTLIIALAQGKLVSTTKQKVRGKVIEFESRQVV